RNGEKCSAEPATQTPVNTGDFYSFKIPRSGFETWSLAGQKIPHHKLAQVQNERLWWRRGFELALIASG
ncbi:MAG: hypothetical protein NT123_21600, partial [Proteobacteria bacterium]|nr:hypothetical protein [Pseudomonadota bacterium]